MGGRFFRKCEAVAKNRLGWDRLMACAAGARPSLPPMAHPPTCWQSSLMALAMTIAPLPAATTIGFTTVPPAAPEADFTPRELIQAAERAVASADWPTAEAHLAMLVATYHATPEMNEPVRRARPMWAMARLRQKKLDPETLTVITDALADPAIDPAVADELAFWRGMCVLSSGAMEPARAAFGDYVEGSHAGASRLPESARPARRRRCAEAVLLQAGCLLQDDRAGEAAALLAPYLTIFRKQRLTDPAGRAAVMRLHALMAAADHQRALEFVQETQPHLHEISQLVAWHLLVLQLGAHHLESGRPHHAIVCLQRVWPQARIVAHQQSAQARLASRLQVAQRTPEQQVVAHQLESALERIERELDAFAKMESFDAALRFRVAAAYRDLGRAREAALVLEDMLSRLPPDAVVAQASLSQIQCWMQIEAWPRAVAAADVYLDRFRRPDNADVPMVRFLKATAMHADRRPHDAELAFATVHQLHRDHDLAPRALFMEGICLLEQDLYREALDAFAEIHQRFPKSDVVEDADYWAAMALSFDKQHDAARNRLRAYLATHKESGRYATEARFRIAFSTFGMAEYPDAAKQMSAFASAHPDHPLTAEAHLLLGDAYGALGQIDAAVAAYRAVDRAVNVRFFEEAVFRIGNAYKISEQADALRAHFGQFLADHPTSSRLAEAVYWIGQSHQRAGRPEDAREVYWQVIQTHGDDAAAAGIEDVLLALPKLYAGEAATDDLVSQLTALAAKARPKQPTLALRTRWAKAHVLAPNHPEPARTDLADLRPLIDPRRHHPRLLADCADALRLLGRTDDARSLYLDLRKWHPRALEKDRAFLGLGMLALGEHKPVEALEYFDRFERETIGSPMLGEVARLRAGILEEDNRLAEAQVEYERLLEWPSVPRQVKAQTLIRLGDLLVRQNQHLKSTVYYERVYVSYGKFLPEVASAYARRAEALDHLGHREAAIEVWRELADRAELAEFPDASRARTRLRALGVDLSPVAASPVAAAPSSSRPADAPPDAPPDAVDTGAAAASPPPATTP